MHRKQGENHLRSRLIFAEYCQPRLRLSDLTKYVMGTCGFTPKSRGMQFHFVPFYTLYISIYNIVCLKKCNHNLILKNHLLIYPVLN